MEIKLKDSAILYSKAGLKITPIKEDGNVPVIEFWQEKATNDSSIINHWWHENPNYNLGIVLGKQINGKILLVIHFDMNYNNFNKDDNIVSYNSEIISRYNNVEKSFPKTKTVQSPNGDLFLYYYVEKEYNSCTDLYTGINIYCNNGYVIAPPSIVDNKEYIEKTNFPIADADENVYLFLDEPNSNENNTLEKLPIKDDNKLLKNHKDSVLDEYFSAVKLSDVEEKEIEWLIEDYFPKNCISLIVGDGGVGKTFVWCDILSALSNGTYTFFENKNYFDFHPRKPMKVMYFSGEDDTASVINCRMSKMFANQDNIIL
ncbi:MAG: bifunctional DNA primase/polymerase, partial [Clostridiales bacterium]|nr:bifunctional DNA primase/polymerase [Clostridiales bacterium]